MDRTMPFPLCKILVQLTLLGTRAMHEPVKMAVWESWHNVHNLKGVEAGNGTVSKHTCSNTIPSLISLFVQPDSGPYNSRNEQEDNARTISRLSTWGPADRFDRLEQCLWNCYKLDLFKKDRNKNFHDFWNIWTQWKYILKSFWLWQIWSLPQIHQTHTHTLGSVRFQNCLWI